MQSIALTDVRLLGLLSAIVSLDVLVLLIWTFVAPFTTSNTSPYQCIPSNTGVAFVMYVVMSWLKWIFIYDAYRGSRAFYKCFYFQN